MRNLKAPTGQTARWLERLATYDLVPVHRAGKSHGNADAMSRKPCASCKRQELLDQENRMTEEPECSSSVPEIRVTTRQQNVPEGT